MGRSVVSEFTSTRPARPAQAPRDAQISPSRRRHGNLAKRGAATPPPIGTVKVLLPPKRSALLLLVAAAFAFRLTYLFQEAVNNPLFATPVVDAEVYTSWAAEILQGKIWWPDVRNYLPIYPAFIALCEVVGGAGPWPVKLTQSLLSSVAAMLMAVVVSRAFGRRAGILAGSLFALSWTLVLFDAERYSESLCVDALVGFLYLATLPERSRATSVAAGATLAIACACRLNLLPLVALGAATILWDPERFRLRVVHALAFVAIPVALVAAALGHNHRVSGSWMLRSQQSWNLYAAFDPEIGGLHPAAGAEFNKYMNRPIHAGMTTPGEQDGYWRRSAFTLLRTRPAAVLYNFIVRRSAIAVDDVEWSQEFDAYKYRNYSSLLSLPLPGFGWNLCLAAGGLTFLATRRFRTGFLRRPRRGTALVVAGFAPVALLAFPDWADLAHRQTAHHEYFIGLQASREGRLVDAEQAYLTAIQAQAFDPDSPYELARLYAREGRLTNALSAVETALQREPDFWEALNLQASIALDLGQRALARSSIQRSLQQYSDQPDAWVLASELTFKEGDFTAWRVAAKQANVHGAGASFAREDALRLAERGRSEEAAAVLRISSVDPRLTPADAASNLMLGCHIQLMEIADHGGAPSCWRELLTRFAAVEPVADQARFLLGELSEADYCRRARSAPNSVWSDLSFFNQGVNHLFRGQPEAARGAFAEYLARHPDATATPPTVPLRLAWDAVHPPAGGQPRP
jgi:tetratricopeptide (TPR) repeat protein